MKFNDLLEANIAAKIKDPKTLKMLGIAMRHDGTLPPSTISKLIGKNVTDETKLQIWSKLLDNTLQNTNYGDISQESGFDDWLTKLYINGVVNFEDIHGEGGEALGAWLALSRRGLLKPQHQDFNRFPSLESLQRAVRARDYQRILEKIKDQENIERHKRQKKEIVLIDNQRFYVFIPLNYGSCYTFNNSEGYQASYCTGSSSGLHWFERYAPQGPLISIIDKSNINNGDGKWQIHTESTQLVNADQDRRYDREYNDKKFGELFPGLMTEIINALRAKAPEIKEQSKNITRNVQGYDVEREIQNIADLFPHAVASKIEEPKHSEPGDLLRSIGVPIPRRDNN